MQSNMPGRPFSQKQWLCSRRPAGQRSIVTRPELIVCKKDGLKRAKGSPTDFNLCLRARRVNDRAEGRWFSDVFVLGWKNERPPMTPVRVLSEWFLQFCMIYIHYLYTLCTGISDTLDWCDDSLCVHAGKFLCVFSSSVCPVFMDVIVTSSGKLYKFLKPTLTRICWSQVKVTVTYAGDMLSF